MFGTLEIMPCLIEIRRLLFIFWVSKKSTFDVRFRNMLIFISEKLEIAYDTLPNFLLISFDCGLYKIWLRHLVILFDFGENGFCMAIETATLLGLWEYDMW